jgi:menaquinone-dependent protoporphyrinogen oxidase
MKILVAYASAHGSTAEVAEFIGRVLTTYSAEVDVADTKTVTNVDGYDAFVLGSAVHSGVWLQEMLLFFDRFAEQIAQKPNYFWVSCIRALEADGLLHAEMYYFNHRLLQSVNTRDIAVLTGKLKTEEITRGEQWSLAANYDGRMLPGALHQDFRDWQAIATWANQIAKELKLTPVFETEADVTAV